MKRTLSILFLISFVATCLGQLPPYVRSPFTTNSPATISNIVSSIAGANGIQQLNGSGTNTTLTTPTLKGTVEFQSSGITMTPYADGGETGLAIVCEGGSTNALIPYNDGASIRFPNGILFSETPTDTVPKIKTTGTSVKVRLGDDSADAPITASDGTFSGAISAPTVSATNAIFDNIYGNFATATNGAGNTPLFSASPGNASGLTNLPATSLTGTIPLPRLPGLVVTNESATENAYAIGASSGADASGALAYGPEAQATGVDSVAIGSQTYATAWDATAIGAGAVAGHASSVALGALAQTTAANQIRLGTASDTVSVPGSLSVPGSGTNTLGPTVFTGTITGNGAGLTNLSSTSLPSNTLRSGYTNLTGSTTSDIALRIDSAAGRPLMFIDGTGRVAFGKNDPSTMTEQFEMTRTLTGTPTENMYGLRSTFSLSADESPYGFASMLGEMYVPAGNTNNYNLVRGNYGYVKHSGTGILTNQMGSYNICSSLLGGRTLEATLFYGGYDLYSTSRVDDLAVFRVRDVYLLGDNRAGTFSGVKIPALVGGTNTYGIWSAASSNRFDGRIQLASGVGNASALGFGNGAYLYPYTVSGARLDASTGFFVADGATVEFSVTNSSVGVMTTTPLAKLHVEGPTVATHSKGHVFVASSSGYAIDRGGQISLGGPYNAAGTMWQFGGIAGRKVNATDGSAAGYLSLSAASGAGTLTEGMRLNYDGKVGIGTTVPSSLLSVAGETGSDTLRVTNLASFVGTVGVLTANPLAKLHVEGPNVVTHSKGHVFVASSSGYAIDRGGQISLGGPYNTAGDMWQFGGIAGRKYNATDGEAAGYLSLSAANGAGSLTEGIRLIYDGKVGVGTASPTSLLSVAGETGTDSLRVTNNATIGGTVTATTANTVTPAFKSLGTNNIILRCPDGGSFILRIDNAGTISTTTNSSNL